MINKKLIIFLAILTVFMSVAVAADVNETTDFETSTQTIATQDTPNVQDIETIANEDNNKITKENKNIKEDTASTIAVDNDNFDDYFTDAGLTGVNDGDTLTFTSDVTRTSNSYIVNKQVNILGNNFTLDLNTINGYDSQSNPTYIEFNSQASNSNISYLKFHNTQVFTTTASNITFDHITDTINNQGVGKGTGYFAMRNGVINITVKNSYFHAANNTGCSAIVITLGENCTIDNNTVIGEGTVGNLLYLNLWGAAGNTNGITQNKNNVISNNTIIGPETPSSICIGMVIGGPHNHIINNTINYTGTGINGNWAGTYDSATNTTNDYYNDTYYGNGYINNTINNGASFSGAQYSLVAGNNFTGTATIQKYSTVKDNRFYNTATINQYSNVTDNQFNGTVTIKKYSNVINNTFNDTVTINEYSNVTNNIFKSDVTLKNNINFKNDNAENSTVTVTGPNCYLCNNTINHLIVNEVATNTLLCEDELSLINTITDTEENIVYVSHPDSITSNNLNSLLNKKSNQQVKYDGETIVIDITESNFAEWFRVSGTIVDLPNTNIKEFENNNIVMNMSYLPENFDQFKINAISNKINLSLDFNGLTMHNVQIDIRSINVFNLKLVLDEEYTSTGYACIVGKENDNLTINYNKDYNENMKPLTNLNKKTLKNSNINATIPSTSESYVLLESRSNAKFINNNITIEEKYQSGENPPYSLIAIGISNYNDIEIEGNNIKISGDEGGNLYAINGSATNVNITNNNITVTSTEGTATGVEITGNNNTVTDNYLVANDKAGDDAVTSTGEGNVVENNTGDAIEVDRRIATSIELENNDNPIDVGQRLIIRGLFKANKVESETSDIKVYDNNELIATTSSDEFGTITYAYIPTVSGSHNITFAFEGNDTHKNTSTTITVEVNEVIEPAKEYSLKIDTTEFTQKTPTTITASIYYGNENEEEIATNISKGKVTFKVDGKTLKDDNGKTIYAKVVNGTATIENYTIPTTWNENTTIQAVYSGSNDVAKMSSEKTNITITQEEPTLTTEDKQATASSTITLTATLSDNTITGKIVFKVNGKTVKDENGKVIYAKVTNGTASVEYTIPENMKTGNYTITAVYTYANYPKLEDTKTLTIN